MHPRTPRLYSVRFSPGRPPRGQRIQRKGSRTSESRPGATGTPRRAGAGRAIGGTLAPVARNVCMGLGCGGRNRMPPLGERRWAVVPLPTAAHGDAFGRIWGVPRATGAGPGSRWAFSPTRSVVRWAIVGAPGTGGGAIPLEGETAPSPSPRRVGALRPPRPPRAPVEAFPVATFVPSPSPSSGARGRPPPRQFTPTRHRPGQWRRRVLRRRRRQAARDPGSVGIAPVYACGRAFGRGR